MEKGFLHFDEVKANHWVEFDGSPVCLLADHLAVHLAFRGNIDNQVALYGGMTTESPARRQGFCAGYRNPVRWP